MNVKVETPLWEIRFSVGNSMLDKQHQILLQLCEQAAQCSQDDSIKGADRLQRILNDLSAYSSEHFNAEERLLRQHNYPDLLEHQAEHQGYLMRINEFLTAAKSGTFDKYQLFLYLAEWWRKHISESDMRYSKFLALRPRHWI